MSDQQAAGVVRAVHAAGLAIPDDVAVTGWDDAGVAAQLGLTTVAQSIRDQGAACATPRSDSIQTAMPRRGRSSTEAVPDSGEQHPHPTAGAGPASSDRNVALHAVNQLGGAADPPLAG
jgi:hypothetical protein